MNLDSWNPFLSIVMQCYWNIELIINPKADISDEE